VREVALGDGLELALLVAGKGHAQALVVLEALERLGQDGLEQLLVAQPVVVIDEIVQGGIHGGVLHALEIAARGGAESSPVLGALVHDEHVLDEAAGG